MSTGNSSDIRKQVKLINPEQLYQVRDENGQLIDFEQANGRELFNHYRHSMTNYDQVLSNIRAGQGYVAGRQRKEVAVGAAEQILEEYRDEHVKVIKDSQQKGQILKDLIRKAGVGTASALVNLLDSWSEKIKNVSKLENSQRTLQSWNDTYRVQRELVKELLINQEVPKKLLIRSMLFTAPAQLIKQEKWVLACSTWKNPKSSNLLSLLFGILSTGRRGHRENASG